MTRSDMREHTFKILFRVPFHDKNELREQIDYYFDEFPDVKEKEYEYIKKNGLNYQPVFLICFFRNLLNQQLFSLRKQSYLLFCHE